MKAEDSKTRGGNMRLLIVLVAVVGLAVAPSALANRVMPCSPFDPCAPLADDPPAPAPDPDGICAEHGGELFRVPIVEDQFLTYTYVICADGTVLQIVEQAVWNGYNEPVAEPEPYYAGEPTDEPAPWSSVCVDDEGTGICGC